MHLAIPSAIGYFYNIQKALTHASSTTSYLSNAFHEDIAHWRTLINAMALRPTYTTEIVQRVPTDFGFTDASGQGAGGVWLNPNRDGRHYIWRLKWPADIIAALVSFTNPNSSITNSDLELAALVLQEATFPLLCDDSQWRAPATGSDNTPTVSWSFKEPSTHFHLNQY